MGTADDQIRVSSSVKRELERRKRDDESFNDVIERMMAEDRDLLSGFGYWSDERAERVRDARKRSKQKSKERMKRRDDV